MSLRIIYGDVKKRNTIPARDMFNIPSFVNGNFGVSACEEYLDYWTERNKKDNWTLDSVLADKLREVQA